MINEEKNENARLRIGPDGFAEPPRVKSAPSPMDALRAAEMPVDRTGRVPEAEPADRPSLAVNSAAKAAPESLGVRGSLLDTIAAAMGHTAAPPNPGRPALLEAPAEPARMIASPEHECHTERSATVVSVRHWSMLGPACGRCWSHWYTETELSTGDEVLTCYCCRAAVDGESKLAEWESVKAKRIAAREGADGADGMEAVGGAETGKDVGKPKKRQSK